MSLEERRLFHRENKVLIDRVLTGDASAVTDLLARAAHVPRFGGMSRGAGMWVQLATLSTSLFDTSISTGDPKGTVRLNTPEGDVLLPYRDAVLFMIGYAIAKGGK